MAIRYGMTLFLRLFFADYESYAKFLMKIFFYLGGNLKKPKKLEYRTYISKKKRCSGIEFSL